MAQIAAHLAGARTLIDHLAGVAEHWFAVLVGPRMFAILSQTDWSLVRALALFGIFFGCFLLYVLPGGNPDNDGDLEDLY